MVRPIPAGYHCITPYLVVKDAAKAIDFYKRAFNAEEVMRMPGPGGKGVMHAELKIGDSHIMLADEAPQGGARSPQTLHGTTCQLFLYVPDVDAAYRQAIGAGASAVAAVSDMFWGDRYGQVSDPFGHQWGLATHKEDVEPLEMQKRSEAFLAQMAHSSTAKSRRAGA